MCNVTTIAMSTRSKFIVTAAVAVLGLASPASAQSYNRTEGSGNSLPMYYDSQGGQHCGRLAACTGIAPQQIQIAADRSGVNAFASVPRGLRRTKTFLMRPAEQQRMRRFRDAALELMSARGTKRTSKSY